MNESIIKFIEKQKCASICCVNEEGKPYCFSCFYVFSSQHGLLYFKSSSAARHSAIISNNPLIAGTILPDKLNVLLVKGIQFEGVILPENHPFTQQASAHYYKKNPAALAMPGEVWAIQIDSIKMTDSTMGFGKKITWNRNEKNLQ
jgi:uncharacterized protein YhbP (UPF0306 family)